MCAYRASLHRRCRYGLQVQALDSLAKALHVEVLELRRERARALSSRGLWGHLKNLLGYLLSVYCLFKYATITFYKIHIYQMYAFTNSLVPSIAVAHLVSANKCRVPQLINVITYMCSSRC